MILRLYIGTYTQAMSFVRGLGKGIYTCHFDSECGKLEIVGETEAQNPSYLAVHPNGGCLYAVNEISEGQEPAPDTVSAYSLDESTGLPQLLNQQPALGSSPCHVSVDPSGRAAFIATYAGGNISVYPLGAEGALGSASGHIQHAYPGKQPHAHSINLSPSGKFALVCDLGLDRIFVYQVDLQNGKLQPHGEVETVPGSGPRHLAFHPNGRFVYVINELDGSVNMLSWDELSGKLNLIQTISTLQAGFSGPAHCADVHVHPNGRFVYGSNRGDHSIVIYGVDETNGMLHLLAHASTYGKSPRSFVLDPAGKWLLAANQDSDNITVFQVNRETGSLERFDSLAIPTPVCVKFGKAVS
jgi:6-phosphogluconolactonase